MKQLSAFVLALLGCAVLYAQAPLGNAVAQLGLKLESRKAPIDMLVVDEVLRTPTEN